MILLHVQMRFVVTICTVGLTHVSFLYRAMHFSAKRAIAIVILYVCLSVCLSVCYVRAG